MSRRGEEGSWERSNWEYQESIQEDRKRYNPLYIDIEVEKKEVIEKIELPEEKLKIKSKYKLDRIIKAKKRKDILKNDIKKGIENLEKYIIRDKDNERLLKHWDAELIKYKRWLSEYK